MTSSAPAYPPPSGQPLGEAAFGADAGTTRTDDERPPQPENRRRAMIEFMLLLAAFAVVGALLGLVWAHFAPGRPLGYVVSKDAIIPDETESFIATDGRFAIFTAVVGAIFGAAAWTRRGTRGPIMVLTLALGGLIGALLTSVVGTAVGGGSASGTPNTVITMQLAVHAKPMLAFEAFTAVFVYTLAVLFTDRTDLGRGDPADQWRTDASGDQVSVTSPAQPVPQPTAEAAPESLTHPVPQPPVTPESFRPE